MKRPSPFLVLALLAVVCFCLATVLQPRAAAWTDRAQSGGVVKMLLGDGRRMFANQFFVQADVAFHSGYYPSIFDQVEKPKEAAMAKTHEQSEHDEHEHEKAMAFLGKPRDWIESFGRHFRVTEHTHLSEGQEREILPWLRLSAELDPQRVETYTVAAYWLRSRLGRVKEAQEFLREGLRNNPNSYEILFELGRLYYENDHDPVRARNVWELALRRWTEGEAPKKDPDLLSLEKIAVNLAHLEEEQSNYARATAMLEIAQKASRHPEALQKQIDDLKTKLSSAPK